MQPAGRSRSALALNLTGPRGGRTLPWAREAHLLFPDRGLRLPTIDSRTVNSKKIITPFRTSSSRWASTVPHMRRGQTHTHPLRIPALPSTVMTLDVRMAGRATRAGHLHRPHSSGLLRRGFVTGRRSDRNQGPSGRRRVEVNLSESADQVVLGYAKKYGRKLLWEWPLQGLKYGALALLATGGAGYMAASAVAQKTRSLFSGKEVMSFDPKAKKEEGFFSRLLKRHFKEVMAHEVSRSMSIMMVINQDFMLRREMGGDMTIDVESQLDRTDYLNQTEANKHPRFEMSTVRTWEYDEYWIVSESGKRARLCVHSFLDEKEDVERKAKEKAEKRRKKKNKETEENTTENQEEEKKYDWNFAHISAFFDGDSRQLVVTHDEEAAGKDILILPDAEWSGDELSSKGEHAEALREEEEEPPRRPHAPQFIDAEVVTPPTRQSDSGL